MSATSKGSIIQRHGAWYWRRRQAGKDLRLIRLGSISQLTRRSACEQRDRLLIHNNPVSLGQGKSTTVAYLASLYDQLRISVTMKPSGARSARSRVFKHIVPFFGSDELMSVDALRTQQFIAQLTGQGLSRGTINAILASLSCLLDFARQSGIPAPRLDRKMIRLPKPALSHEERWFTPSQAAAIVETAPMPWKAAFALASILGLRCGEVLGLRWSDIDFGKRIIRIRQNAVAGVLGTVKSRNSRADLPIPDALETVLKELREFAPTRDLLFANEHGQPYTGNEARQALRIILSQLKIPPAGMHAFRHGAVTRLLDSGAPIHVVRAVVRHADIRTTERYSHAQADALRTAINASIQPQNTGEQKGNNL